VQKYQKEVKKCINPFGTGDTSKSIVEILKNNVGNTKLLLKEIK